MRQSRSILLAFAILTGCNTVIKDFEKYQKAPLLSTEFMPSKEQLQDNTPSVVVFKFSTDDANSKNAGIPGIIEDSITQVLVSHKLANIVSRDKAEKLQSEIMLSEVKKSGSYVGPLVADYAIMGEVGSSSSAVEFVNGSSYTDKDGVTHKSPDQYKHSANVSGAIKIYQIPSLKILLSSTLAGNSVKYEDVKKQSDLEMIANLVANKNQSSETKGFDVGLAKNAARNAVQSSETQIKNFFAKTGYILSKKEYEGKVIFETTLGIKDGIGQNDNLMVLQKKSSHNPLTDEDEYDQVEIVKAKIADHNSDTRSWIVIKDQTKASEIKLGDVVKVFYK